ncbi:MAG TPA: PAS domain S-box protein [Vicinamibacterales bacterium]|jgi:PAS domain S-box-containing protein
MLIQLRKGPSAVLESNERYRRLVELSPDGILISQDARIAFLNPAATRLFGAASADELIGRSIFDVFQPQSGALLRERIDRLLAGAAVAPFDEQISRKDGAIADVEVIGTLLEDGERRAIQLVLRDMTERKIAEAALRESEERLRLAFVGAQEGVWDWNLETGYVVYSPRWKQMLGYAEEEIEPHVREWERLLHPDDMPRARQLNESVERGDPTYQGEFRLRHKEGHYIHVLSRGFPVRREPGGPVVRIVGTHFDLTERRRIEAERARTELLARLVFAQEDERRRIAREMHDQFGEQLTSLSREIGALKEACDGRTDLSARVRALEKIAQQLDRDVDHLVWELRPTALDDLGLRAALTNYVQDWSARAKISAALHTSGLLDDRLPSEVETTLYRIAQEALTNVARHSKAKNVDVILERHGDAVVLIVEDDGIGLEASDTARPERDRGDTEDRGFGLLGMHERAALVGATLQIESSSSGTTVLLRMNAPAAEAPDHA